MTPRQGTRFPLVELVDLLKVLRSQALGAPDVAEHLRVDEERARNVLRELVEQGMVAQVQATRQIPRRGRTAALFRLSADWGGCD